MFHDTSAFIASVQELMIPEEDENQPGIDEPSYEFNKVESI